MFILCIDSIKNNNRFFLIEPFSSAILDILHLTLNCTYTPHNEPIVERTEDTVNGIFNRSRTQMKDVIISESVELNYKSLKFTEL